MSDASRITELEEQLHAAQTMLAWIVTEAGGEVHLDSHTLTRFMLRKNETWLVIRDTPDCLGRAVTCEATDKVPTKPPHTVLVSRTKVF